MGKKRPRFLNRTKSADDGPDPSLQHSQPFTDEIRETRDAEFAAEKRQVERSKRRKLSAELELSSVRKVSKNLKQSGTKAQRQGLEVWKKAALRRKARADNDGQQNDDLDTLEDAAIDPKTTAKIFEQAREQRAEIRNETLASVAEEAARVNGSIGDELRDVGARNPVATVVDSDDESGDDERSNADTEGALKTGEESELAFLDASKITEEDELAIAMFSSMNKVEEKTDENADASGPRIMLADIILEKIREKEEADAKAAALAADPERAARDRKIAEVYGLVGNIMSKYRSGKVPKAFKIIPKLSNWEDLMYLTRPDEWSPAAVYVATRLLASNLSAKQVVKFYTDILLPRCLEDISEHKKLNYHLYRALGKATYKPDAFNKGILFPLCEDHSCTLRQATIIGSVVSKVSLPMLHSAAALLFICQLPYSPPNSVILTALLEKKYALPYRVVDAVVESFLKMKSDPRPLPVLWHQCLLTFAQRYKMELTMEQKERLKHLMRVHMHHAVTAEIRRELFSARNRGDLMDPDSNTIAKAIASAS